MAKRPLDLVSVEAENLGVLDRFTSFEIVNDLIEPASASFEVGDDGTWAEIEDFVRPGTKYRVHVNGKLRLTGRIERVDAPVDLQGAVVRFTVRSKLSDAMFASADPRVKVKGTTIKQFLLNLFEMLGYKESDFIFDADVSRDIMTGVSRTTGKPPADLEPIREDQAKIALPETVYAAADRHLRRFGLMLWDSPDGRIVVGAPNDEQEPLYDLRMVTFNGSGDANNLLSATRVRDWSALPSFVFVYGHGAAWGSPEKGIRGRAQDTDSLEAGFFRPVIIMQEAMKSQALADRGAAREMAARAKMKEAWDVAMDGLSYWTGDQRIEFGIDTVANITTTVAGGPAGPYLVHRTVLKRDANLGDVAELGLVAKGLWKL